MGVLTAVVGLIQISTDGNRFLKYNIGRQTCCSSIHGRPFKYVLHDIANSDNYEKRKISHDTHSEWNPCRRGENVHDQWLTEVQERQTGRLTDKDRERKKETERVRERQRERMHKVKREL